MKATTAPTSATGPIDRKLQRLAAAINIDAVLDQILGALPREVSAYERISNDPRAMRVAPLVREILLSAIPSIATGTDVSAEAKARMAATAGEGMPLEEILKAYRIGARIGWHAFRRAAQPGDEEALLIGAERLMAYLGVVTLSVTRAYLLDRQGLVSERERSARHLLAALDERVNRWPTDVDLAENYSLEFGGPFVPFAFALPGERAMGHGNAADRLRASKVLAISEGDRVVGLSSIDAGPLNLDEIHLGTVGMAVPAGRIDDAMRVLRATLTVASRDGRRGRLMVVGGCSGGVARTESGRRGIVGRVHVRRPF